MKKRRQHHVWRHYLEPWTTKGQIWCLQSGEKIFRTNALNVAVESNFYKLNRLNEDDFAFIDYIIQQSPPQSAETLRGFVQIFSIWYTIKDLLAPNSQRNKIALQYVEEQIVNFEENYHSAIEETAISILHSLRNGNVDSFHDDDKMMTFCYFLALQWLRTRAIKLRLIDTYMIQSNIDISRSWNIISHIFAANLGCSLFISRRQNSFRLIANRTELAFLTGDQPVINLRQAQNIGEAPKYLALYYPISKRYAFFIDDAESPLGLGEVLTSQEDVRVINDRMVAASHFQIFGDTRESLTSYLPSRKH